MPPSRCAIGALATALGLVSSSGRARAEPPPPAPLGASTVAESLFREALVLMQQGAYDRACSKLEESERLDPGGGTVLNLARCYEGQGRIATAWSTYREALGYAHRDHREERATFAEERLASLEPRLPRLRFRLPDEDRGITVFVDNVPMHAAALDAPQPVDPGVHTIRATAVGRQEYSATVRLAEREAREISVPPLAPDPGTASPDSILRPAPAPELTPSHGATRQVLGATTIALGGAGLVTGIVFGVLALDANSTANSLCPGNGPCGDSTGLSASDRAHSFGTVSTISLIAGAALVIGGAVLLLTAPSGR
jgi:tetratricopeptide (TPR) repeat protein